MTLPLPGPPTPDQARAALDVLEQLVDAETGAPQPAAEPPADPPAPDATPAPADAPQADAEPPADPSSDATSEQPAVATTEPAANYVTDRPLRRVTCPACNAQLLVTTA